MVFVHGHLDLPVDVEVVLVLDEVGANEDKDSLVEGDRFTKGGPAASPFEVWEKGPRKKY